MRFLHSFCLSIILLLHSPFSYSGILIPIREEIAAVTKAISQDTLSSDSLNSYLNFLRNVTPDLPKLWPTHTQIIKLPFLSVIPKTEPVIDSDVKEHVLAALQERSQIFPKGISDRELYYLIRHIETQKSRWIAQFRSRSDFQIPSYSIHYLNGETEEVDFILNRNNDLLLKLGSSFLGSGTAKTAEKVIAYRNFKSYARITPQPETWSTWTQKQLKREIQLIHYLSLDTQKKRGLVEIKSMDSGSILETLYSFDLNELLYGSQNKFISTLSKRDRLELISQFSDGLAYLHEKDLLHGDIKESNILIKTVNNGDHLEITEAVLADFDHAIFHPLDGEHYGNGIFAAPEYYEPKDYSGDSANTKLSTILKSDVFAIATVALNLMKADDTSQWQDVALWSHYCGSQFSQDLSFYECQMEQIRYFIESEKWAKNLNFFDHLVAAAIQPNPKNRLTSKQWANGIHQIQSDFMGRHSPKGVTPQKLESLYAEFHYWPKSEKQKALNKIATQPLGSYILLETSLTHKGSLISLVFRDNYEGTQHKTIPIDYSNPILFQKAIEFLKAVGTLKTQIELAH